MILQVILEGIGLGVLLILVCAIGIRKGAVGMVHLYSPEVQERCVTLGLSPSLVSFFFTFRASAAEPPHRPMAVPTIIPRPTLSVTIPKSTPRLMPMARPREMPVVIEWSAESSESFSL